MKGTSPQHDKGRRHHLTHYRARAPWRALGELSEPQACPFCEGDGVQLEQVWRGGEDPFERHVRCYGCRGQGRVVRLLCGRCGAEELAEPDDSSDALRVCAWCGHEAPQALWLPMRHTAGQPAHHDDHQDDDEQETA